MDGGRQARVGLGIGHGRLTTGPDGQRQMTEGSTARHAANGIVGETDVAAPSGGRAKVAVIAEIAGL